MSEHSTPDQSIGDVDGETESETRLSIQHPEHLRDREGVRVTSETQEHEDGDFCVSDVPGQVVVAVENDDGELLLLRNDEFGVAVLPHGDVADGDDWATAAREEIEALTGISISLNSVELVREIDHTVDGDADGTTYRLLFSGGQVGGAIQDCKRSADEGSDEWWAVWTDGLPDDVEVPGGGPGDDLRYVLD